MGIFFFIQTLFPFKLFSAFLGGRYKITLSRSNKVEFTHMATMVSYFQRGRCIQVKLFFYFISNINCKVQVIWLSTILSLGHSKTTLTRGRGLMVHKFSIFVIAMVYKFQHMAGQVCGQKRPKCYQRSLWMTPCKKKLLYRHFQRPHPGNISERLFIIFLPQYGTVSLLPHFSFRVQCTRFQREKVMTDAKNSEASFRHAML